MSHYRRAAKVDASQAEIVKKLRDAGCTVKTGVDDLLVGAFGLNFWFECKTPTKAWGVRKRKDATNDRQAELRRTWAGQIDVVTCFEDAWRIITNSQPDAERLFWKQALKERARETAAPSEANA